MGIQIENNWALYNNPIPTWSQPMAQIQIPTCVLQLAQELAHVFPQIVNDGWAAQFEGISETTLKVWGANAESKFHMIWLIVTIFLKEKCQTLTSFKAAAMWYEQGSKT